MKAYYITMAVIVVAFFGYLSYESYLDAQVKISNSQNRQAAIIIDSLQKSNDNLRVVLQRKRAELLAEKLRNGRRH